MARDQSSGTRSRPVLSAFTAGEWSPRLQGRVDLERYHQAAETIENFLVQPQGGLARRPGSHYVGDTKGDRPATLVPFVRGPDISYMLELGNRYIRPYCNQARIMTLPATTVLQNGNFATGLSPGWTNESTGSASVTTANDPNLIARTSGTPIGNMTDGDGLAAAFDGTEKKKFLDCAIYGRNTAWIGKDWGSGVTRTINKVVIYSSSDYGLKRIESPRVKLTLQGSTDNFKKSIVDLAELSVQDRDDVQVTMEDSIVTTTAYRYHRIYLTGGKSEAGFAISQVEFWQAGSALKRARLLPNGGTAILQQILTIPTGSQGVPHVLRFRVRTTRTGLASVRVGSTAGGTEYLRLTACANGWHTVTFTPEDSPAYLQFRERNEIEVAISDVSLTSAATEQPVEIETPWDDRDRKELRWTQANDVMWMVHERHWPRKLIRKGHTSWSLQEVELFDGPYLDEDPDNTTTITASSAVGDITLTASRSLFRPGHVGALWRLCSPGGSPGYPTWKTNESVTSGSTFRIYADNLYICRTTATTGNTPPTHESGTVSDGAVEWEHVNRKGWGWVRITDYTSDTVVSASVEQRLDPNMVSGSPSSSTGTTVWREGAFSYVQGFPEIVALADSRLWYGKGNTLYGSSVGLFDDFTPDGRDDDAITVSIDGQQLPVLQWIVGGDGVFVGTTVGPFVIAPPGDDEPMTPANVRARPISASGAAASEAFRVGEAVLYLSRSRQRLHEIGPSSDTSGWRAADLTVIADHILGSGADAIAFSREPQPVLWAMRADGYLATLTYDRGEGVVAWARQIVTGGRVRSLAIIPGFDDTAQRDEVWMVVQRTIDGEVKYQIEFIEHDMRYGALPGEAFFVDSGLTYDNPLPIKSVTISTGVVLRVTAHGLSNGDLVDLDELRGDAENLNQKRFKVGEATADTFRLMHRDTGAAVMAADHDVTYWSSHGVVRKAVSSVSGLDHLEGRLVKVLGDGAELADRTVSGGAISLSYPSGVVTVGLPQTYRYKSLKLAQGGTVGPAIAAKRKISGVAIGLIGSLECRIGPDEDHLAVVRVRYASDPMDKAPPLRVIEQKVDYPAGWLTDPRIYIQGNSPLPLNITHFVIDDVRTEELV